MSATATSPTRIVNRVSCWSQPGHGDARPHSYPPALSKAQSAPKAILIGAKESLRSISARRHLTDTLSHLAYTVKTAIKSP
jgi:hypothetical protein